jgi:hypothetical protein
MGKTRRRLPPRVQTAGLKPPALRGTLHQAPSFPAENRTPPGWLLDIIAEEKFTGEPRGATRKRKARCLECFEIKSLNGACSCLAA